MGITRKSKTVGIKLALPEPLAQRLREVREAAEAAGFDFDLKDEIAAALDDIVRKLKSLPESSSSMGAALELREEPLDGQF
jgi:hypothetical protein